MKQYISIIFIAISVFSATSGFGQTGFGSVGAVKYKNVYAVIVGISNYSEIKDLNYADKDAQLIFDLLSMRFPESKANFQLLTNDKANQSTIKKHVFNACKAATEEDLVILYFSGHGDVMTVYGVDYGYFLASDASKSREYESGGAVEFEFINRHVNGAASTKKCAVWLITDACRAGKVINESGAKATMNTLNQSFLQTTKFVSCQANELSFEDTTLQQGVFTHFLLKGMSGQAESDGDKTTLTIDELNSFLRTEVRKHTEGKQTPKASAADEFKPFFSPLPTLTNLIHGGKNGDLASKSGGDVPKTKTAFENAILDNDLNESVNSAFNLYKKRSLETGVPAIELEKMKDDLVEALISRGQRSINKYLSGRPLFENENFVAAYSDFRLAEELIGSDHYLIDEVREKKEFLTCMIVVDKNDFQQFKSSEVKLLSLIAANPVAAYLNTGLAQLYYKMNQSEKAREQSNIAHKKVSTWSKPQNITASIYLQNGQLKEAENTLQESQKAETADASSQLLISQLRASNLEYQIAKVELEKIKANKEISESEYALVEALIEQRRGHITTAESIYKKALLKDAENTQLLLGLGELYRLDGDTAKAIRYFQKVLLVEPSHQTAKMQISSLKNGAVTEIYSNFYDTKAALKFAEQYVNQKDFEKAKNLLKEAQKVNPYDPNIDFLFARIAYLDKDNKTAEKYLLSALQKSPYHFESIVSLANIYILQKNFDAARLLIQTYSPNFKYSSKWRVFTYEANAKMEKKNNQLFVLQEAIQLDSTDTEAYKALYRFEMQEGMYTAAEKQYRKMLKFGSRMKDSNEFISELILSVETRVQRGLQDNRTVEGLKIILKYDRFYLSRMMKNAEKFYFDLNYRDADIQLERYGKYLFCMQKADRIAYLELKAKLLLEVKMYQEALDLFRQLNEQSYKTSFVGIAMAQYELGMKEDVWMANLARDQNIQGFNQPAIERYKKMNRNKGHYPSGYK